MDALRARELETLLRITAIPTASGCEWRVADAIKAWVNGRVGLTLSEDSAGNLVVQIGSVSSTGESPLFITAHMDHPAFVVERIVAPGTLELSFRGGVMDVFFIDAPITIVTRDDQRIHAKLIGDAGQQSAAGKHYLAEIESSTPRGARIEVGDVGVWRLPAAEVIDGVLHTPACDDLSALAAALCAADRLIEAKNAGQIVGDVRLLFTRAEEIGFIGAIAACKLGTIPKGSRVLALENSRAMEDSPVGGGPIVRVGDRISVFTPWLTSACAARAEEIFNGPAVPRASQSKAESSKRPWQRKLMSGGACEASVFCAHGFDATCICLPLGNYHNMPWITELQEGKYDKAKHGEPRCAREFNHLDDFFGMVDLLVALGLKLPSSQEFMGRLEKMYQDRKYVLG